MRIKLKQTDPLSLPNDRVERERTAELRAGKVSAERLHNGL